MQMSVGLYHIVPHALTQLGQAEHETDWAQHRYGIYYILNVKHNSNRGVIRSTEIKNCS